MYNWQQSALLIEQTHNKLVQEYGKVQVSRLGKSGWSIRDTAKFLNISVGACSENLRLAKLLKLKPNFANIKQRKDAIFRMRLEGR